MSDGLTSRLAGLAARLRLLLPPPAGEAQAPVNFRVRDASPEAISADVDYGMQIIAGFDSWMRTSGFDVRGARVLELGPGINLAGCIGLRALGAATVIAADRWLAPWQEDYNPVFCEAMASRIRAQHPDWDASIFDQAAREGFGSVLSLVLSAAETLDQHLDAPVDATLSNAVLEHVSDHAATARALARITRPGGMGFHQVDFRYHVDFMRPLDHLLDPPDVFARKAAACSFEMGCQLRPSELAALFEAAGFETQMQCGDFADPVYLDALLVRLRASASAYRDAPEAMLRPIGAYYVLRRPASAA